MKILLAECLIVGDGKTVIEQGGVCIDDQGMILAVGEEQALRASFPGADSLLYQGCTLLPGLIDLHVHVGYWWNKPNHMEYNDALKALMAAKNMREALSLGVTTVRDVSSPEGICETLRVAMEHKYTLGPRMYHVNKAIAMTGGHGWQLTGGLREANGPWEVRAAVREQVKAGADWIKVMASHRTPTPEFTQEELDAAVDETHRLGVRCCVHASLQPSLEMAIKAGFDTIEHGTFMTVAQAEKMAEQGQVWVPTMVTFFQIAEHYRTQVNSQQGMISDAMEKQRAFFIASEKSYRENFAQLMATGVKIATGTDIVLDKYPLTPVAEEVKLMVELGMEPLQAIKAATQTPAEVLQSKRTFGTLQKGHVADILVVEGDPTRDISTLKNIRQVLQAGKVVYPEVSLM